MADNNIRILVIDDEKMVSNILRDFLEDEDFTVEVARSGAEALEKISSGSFEAAIVDMTLDDMDGDHLIKKAHAVNPALICLIHTGALDYTITPDLAALGLTQDHVFYKPIHDMIELSTRIRSLLRDR